MFGYINVYAPELKVRENEFYGAAYCGLCRAMGECTGQCSRMTLSYDAVFMSLIRMSVSGTNPEFDTGRCIAHPFKKRTYIKSCEPLNFCAYASALLAYHKYRDDISDEHGFKRFRAKAAGFFMSGMYKRSVKEFRQLDEYISEMLGNLSRIEAQRLSSVDIPAAVFGQMMGKILSWGLDGTDAKIADEIGIATGKWLYIIDAADDLDEDLKRSRFNPIPLLYGDVSDPAVRERLNSGLETAMICELSAAEPALDLIEWGNRSNLRGVVENIMFLGLPRKTKCVINHTDYLTGKKNDEKGENK